jgi:uncharacterized delta-60 repeat protein
MRRPSGLLALLPLLVPLLLLALAHYAVAAPGDLDPDFGGFGVGGQIADLGFVATAGAIDALGRLVLAGISGGTFHVQRRSGPGFLTVEDEDIVIDPSQVSAVARGVAIAPDGKIVVVGSVDFGGSGGSDFAVARLNPDLTLDTTFAGDGTATVKIGPDGSECARAVTFDGPNHLVLAGYANGGGRPNFALAELETTRDALAATTTTTLPPIACGDANGDGMITATDALIVLRAAVGSSTCAPCQCDTDDSGSIAATDALRVLRTAVGQAVTLQCPLCD